MKKLLTILVLIFASIFIKAQEEVVTGELSVWIKSNPQLKYVSMSLELVSPACWDEDHYITELFNGGTIGFSGFLNEGWLEFLVCWSTDPLFYYKTFGLGLYKITAKVNNVVKDHFFIDYRTSDLPDAINVPPPGCQIDYALDFDVAAEKFYFRSTQNEFSGYHTFWDLRPCVSLITAGLENYWDNALAAIPDNNNNPRIVWGKYPGNPGGSISGYKIYRSGEHAPGQQPGSFSHLATVNSDVSSYIDNTVTMGTDYSARSYYVTCVYDGEWDGLLETDPTNTVEVRLEIPQKSSDDNSDIIDNLSYRLHQNYPNPFNPSTVISYQIPADNYVTLKVFDVLGREVATHKEAGSHSVEFNASDLPSGIYLYRIQVGNYTETQKLILQK